MTDPLDNIPLPFSVLFAPTSTSDQSMPIVKGESHPNPAFAVMPVAALHLHGRWAGNARLRIFLTPRDGGTEQMLIDIPAATSPSVIPPIQCATTGEGGYVRAFVSNHLPGFNMATSQLLLTVIPTMYS